MTKAQSNALRRVAAKRGHEQARVELFDRPKVRTLVRALEMVGIVAGIVGLWAAVLGLMDSNEQTQLARLAFEDQREANTIQQALSLDALNNQRIASGWQILAQPGLGTSGKGYALEIVVNDTDEDLWGLNLGCKPGPLVPVAQPATLYTRPNDDGSAWVSPWINLDKGSGCEFGNVLSGVHLQGSARNNAWSVTGIQTIHKSSFAGANLSDTSFEDLRLVSINFAGADLDSTRFSNVDFSDAIFGDSSPSSMSFDGRSGQTIQFDDVLFLGLNVEEFRMTNAKLDSVIFDRSSLFGTFRNVEFGTTSITNSSLVSTVFEGMEQGSPANFKTGDGLINISGTRFCQISESEDPDEEDSMECVRGLDQAFFDRAWYYTDQPPLALREIPGDFTIMSGCARPETLGVSSLYPNTTECGFDKHVPLSSFPDDEGYP